MTFNNSVDIDGCSDILHGDLTKVPEMNYSNRPPKLYVWENYGLYLGTNYVPLSTYSVTSDQLLLVIEGEIIYRRSDGETMALHSILIRAGATIDMSNVDASSAIIAICYLDPIGQEFTYLQTIMHKGSEEFYYDHPQEAKLINTCLWLRDNEFDIESVEPHFRDMLIPTELRSTQLKQFDERMVKVIRMIRDTITENLSIQDFADHVHMSDSRLRKLFKSQFGVPITRYRLGHRIVTGVLHIANGASITDAALAAGFSSTAHFSKCFRAVTGIHLSAMFLRPPYFDVRIDEAVTKPKSSNAA